LKKEADMRFLATLAAGLAVGACASTVATAQGPVREGLRRTGEIAAEGTRRVAEGTADVARGVGEATAGAARATGRAIGLTPEVPMQARADANLSAADQDREARWRFARHNGEWWYYTPENTWMYHRDGQWQAFSEDAFQPLNQNQQFVQGQQQYAMGYRGLDQGQFDQGFQQQVRVDGYGRQYICENGRPVYVDQTQPLQAQAQPGALAPAPGVEYGAGYRGLEGQRIEGEQTAPTPAEPQQDQAQPAQPQPAQPPAAATPAPAPAEGGQIQTQDQPQGQPSPSPTAPKEERQEPDTSGTQ